MKKRSRQSKPMRLALEVLGGVASQAPDIPRSGLSLANLQRSPDISFVDAGLIESRQVESDPEFLRRYVGFCKGEVDIAMTRVQCADVLSGFVRDLPSPQVIRDPIPSPPEIDELVKHIRSGRRPAPYIYETGRHGFPKYTCADDLPTLEAYRCLGIKEIPVLVMEPTSSTKHARFVFGGLASPDGPAFVFKDSKSGEFIYNSKPTLLCDTAQETLQSCERVLGESLSRLRAFHRSTGSIHYHHCVASYLVRAIRLINSVQHVLKQGIGEAAVVLSRSIYELSACYYIDWLAPETIGDAMKLAAHSNGVDLGHAFQEVENSRVASGWTRDAASAMSRGLRKHLALIGAVSKKVRLTPMRVMHDVLYRWLSRVSHQDATTTAAFAGFLDSGHEPLDIEKQNLHKDASLACSTIAIAAQLLCDCSASDIGTNS